MGFVESISTCFRKYFVFGGRARRSEFWYFMLFCLIAGIILGILDGVLFGAGSSAVSGGAASALSGGPLGNIFSLATFFPSIAVTSRRLHDIDKSGWFQLVWILPLILMVGAFGFSGGGESIGIVVGILGLITFALLILLIVWCATDGHKGDNRFGASPKYDEGASVFE